MTDVNTLVLTGYGLNCDNETAYALELAGARPRRIHINALALGQARLRDFHILVLGGGFGWGDDHGAGVIQALRMKTHLGRDILDFVADGNVVIGICNGFQALANLGLLPGFDNDYQSRSVAVTYNDCGNFRDQWVSLQVNQASPCIFTNGFSLTEFPVRHGEGKFYTDEDTLARLIQNNQVVLRYAQPGGDPAEGRFPHNPNGSLHDIAGICDPTGRIFGLMPHPEAYNHFTNHPDWPQAKEALRRSGRSLPTDPTPGIRLFKNAVEFVRRQFE